MHYAVKYVGEAPDQQAIADVQEYLGPKTWAKFEELFFWAAPSAPIPLSAAKEWIKGIRFACMMVGVQGFPVRALCRKFLAQFGGL